MLRTLLVELTWSRAPKALHSIRFLRAGEDDPPENASGVSSTREICRLLSKRVVFDLFGGLPRRFNSPRFEKIEEYTRQFVGHQFRISSEADLDSELRSWLREAYRVGEQQG